MGRASRAREGRRQTAGDYELLTRMVREAHALADRATGLIDLAMESLTTGETLPPEHIQLIRDGAAQSRALIEQQRNQLDAFTAAVVERQKE